ncbi:MAG: Na+/H+ antiporter NhaA [Paracoccaceae bacterium]
MYRISSFVRWFAWSLAAGVVLATLWVNLDPSGYYDAVEWRIADLPLPAAIAPFPVSLTPLALVSEVLMALFLFFVGKELWEALVLERGALHGRRAALPAAMVAGTVVGGVAVWLLCGAAIETADEASLGSGWTVPVGSDVVLAYVFGRRVFGGGHPALHLLMLITIACDILGLVLTGIAWPAAGGLRLHWLLLPVAAAFGVWWCYGRGPGRRATERQRQQAAALWPYALAGAVSLAGVLAAGLPGALGLLPIIPAIPHAERSFGLFAEAEELLHDPLNRMAHLLVKPLAGVLFLFGLTRGGIDFGAFAPTTLTVLAAFWIGKPLGLLAGFAAAARLTGETLPRGIGPGDLRLVAVLCGIGFTVPVLALDPALPGGAMAEAARLGLALTLLAGPVALVLRRWR